MKTKNNVILPLLAALGIFFGDSVSAADPITAHLTIRHEDVIVFDADVTTSTESAATVLDILQTADEASADFSITDLVYYPSFNDYLLNCLAFGDPETNACYNWKYVVNGDYPSLGIHSYPLAGNERIYLYFGDRYRLETESTDTATDQPLTALFSEYDFETNAWLPAADRELLATEPILPDYSNWPPATVLTATTDLAGSASFTFSAAGTYYITLSNDYWPGVTVTATDPPVQEHDAPVARLVVRHDNTLLFDGELPLPTSTAFSYHDSTGDELTSTTTAQSSVLALLAAADSASDAFAMTDIAYYESFNSFIINCINHVCDNWNYVVDGNYPQVGMADYLLVGSETVFVYFSTPWQITAPASTIDRDAEVLFETWRYQYDNLEETWVRDPNTLVQIAVPNPLSTGWWDATTPLYTITSDATGMATTTFSVTGTFFASITSADFSKWSNPVTITVVEPVAATEETAENAPPSTNNGNTGGGGTPPASTIFDGDAAVAFLVSQQNADGSFGAPLYTDWAAIAFGAVDGASDAENRLAAYLRTNPNPGSLLTDIERRAMALMALGINPYTGTPTNYIETILQSSAGGQFGDVQLFNDDVFAFFPLLRAGIPATDQRIIDATTFILSFQEPNGSWGSVDMTGATLQALSLVPTIPGVSQALTRGAAYLTGATPDNVFSLAWKIQGLSAIGQTPEDSLLRSFQETDGGVTTIPHTANNRVWGTSTAIPAALRKPWGQILASFSPPETEARAQTGQISTNSGSATGGFFIPPQPEELTVTTSIISEEILPSPAPEIENPEPADVSEGAGNPPSLTETPSVAPTAVLSEQTPAPTQNTPRESTPATTEEMTAATAATISGATHRDPVQETARTVFAGSASMTAGLGLYLAWRFLKFLV